MRPTDEGTATAGEEHAQVGVDLGGRAYRAPAAAPHALLVYDDTGGYVSYLIHGRAAELGQPAPGVCAECVYELPLRLGIHRVEYQ